jgi:hypothetical protein
MRHKGRSSSVRWIGRAAHQRSLVRVPGTVALRIAIALRFRRSASAGVHRYSGSDAHHAAVATTALSGHSPERYSRHSVSDGMRSGITLLGRHCHAQTPYGASHAPDALSHKPVLPRRRCGRFSSPGPLSPWLHLSHRMRCRTMRHCRRIRMRCHAAHCFVGIARHACAQRCIVRTCATRLDRLARVLYHTVATYEVHNGFYDATKRRPQRALGAQARGILEDTILTRLAEGCV